jgi:hypothetical protein
LVLSIISLCLLPKNQKQQTNPKQLPFPPKKKSLWWSLLIIPDFDPDILSTAAKKTYWVSSLHDSYLFISFVLSTFGGWEVCSIQCLKA